MATVLAINPNTTEAVTALVERHLRAASPAIEWRMATGRFGARYIVSEAGGCDRHWRRARGQAGRVGREEIDQAFAW